MIIGAVSVPRAATVFARASTGKFFLYHREWDPLWEGGPRKEFRVHAFEGNFSSVEAFIEQADWNHMELMDPVELMQQAQEGQSNTAWPTLALMGEKGFRVAAQEPYQKRTLWEMCPPQGTFGYIPRQLPDRDPDDYPGVSEWPRTPDAVLPEPWSSDWRAFARAFEWHDEVQVNLEERYGHALAGLGPAMFEPADDYPPDTVLCPPGGAGTYYFWGSPLRWEMCWRAQTVSEMQRFRGVFASVEDFVHTADWNSLEEVGRA
ncbi:hypothetical protein C8F04DRAFT_1405673 [Mycena alexandri]|uniref:Uncharacterized protein n=1 Tax=Mycena alexandri TaxID=1745969 RepID=A0AAD6S2H4_9AGAR|nr:hypothetical protein C8F04DRAFT_1405673 [Mycena alexandri]